MLIEGEAGQATVMDHLGVEVDTTDEVDTAKARQSELGLFTAVENDTPAATRRRTRSGSTAPAREPWEVYTVTAGAPDATSIRPPGLPDSETCVCGSPTGAEGEQLSPGC